ncbi:CvpA family protein [uncultured Limosilactobacillus sp.]|uniref:CvpA family protein n=1 Tax=uncultured Limosilactobacillus sp. TaxID=2837629 RepID=UPI0025E110D9|nr:CvpA family protein [uncultured Limosilactobacillus sp.]
MILSTAILMICVAGIVHGWYRGALAMVVSLGIYLLTLVVARATAPVVGGLLAAGRPELGSPTSFTASLLAHTNATVFFYNGLAFTVIFVVVSWLLHWAARQLNWLRHLPLFGGLNSFVGAAMAGIITYLMVYVLLLVFQLWPNGWWQYQFSQSEVAQWVVNNTPQLASLIVGWLG